MKYFDVIFKNSDYYSFLVHLCQKKEYDLSKLQEHQDTFFEGMLSKFLQDPKNKRYKNISFRLELSGEESLTNEGVLKEEELLTHQVLLQEHTSSFTTSNIKFIRV